jgi:threonine/homoserine/homoserine lactone efflux protein
MRAFATRYCQVKPTIYSVGMTVTFYQLLAYSGALVALFLTPGPVWVALTARTLAGGFAAAWPLAVGVTLGDILWPLVAILGVSWMVGQFADFMAVLKLVAAGIFLLMGVLILRDVNRQISSDSRLTAPGKWSGFAAGVAAILGNPKAILFYMGVLPGFFTVGTLTRPDIAVIVALSMAIPLIGNIFFALLVSKLRDRLTSPRVLRRVNIIAGVLLVLVGLIIPFI